MSPSTPASGPSPPRRRGLLRPLILAVILLPFVAFWSSAMMSDVIFSLLVPPLCALMVVALLNVGLRRVVPGWALTGGELAVFYAFMSVAGAMCAEWLLINNQYIHSYALFADRSPWDREHILPHLPKWFYFTEAAPLEDYRQGGYGLWHFLGRLGLWARPIAAWTLLFTLLCGAMLCINTLMRELWCRREKLAFPIIQVPLLLTRPQDPAWKSPWLWGALSVMFGIDMLNGFAFMNPLIPSINVRFLVGRLADVLPWLQDNPWTAVGWTSLGIFPYMCAIGVFMPTDLLFSCVFFFFLRKAMQVGAAMFGYQQDVFGGGWLVPGPPYFSEQTWGAFLGLFVSAVLFSRGYLQEVWGHIVKGTSFGEGDMRPRSAFYGLILCLAGLGVIGWMCGLSPWLVVGYLCVFLIFAIVLTRMRAQLGPPIHEMAFLGPHQLLIDFLGGQALNEAATVKMYHLFLVTNRIHRTDPMPYQLEGYKLGDQSGLTSRKLFWAILFATVLGVVVGQGAYVLQGYLYGAQPSWGDPNAAIRQLSEQPHPPNPAAMLSVVGGFSLVMLLDAIRTRITGFPLHPVGYALSMNFGIDYCWFGLFIVLLLKLAVQHGGGLKGYEKLRLVAAGVILGEFAAEMIWSSVSMATHMTTYSVSFYNRSGWLK